jgi:amino acid transporter
MDNEAMSNVPIGQTSSHPGLFLRQATGLVREMNTWDAFNIDMTNANAFANVAVLLPLGLALFAGGNLWLSVITGTVAGLSVVLVYVMLAQAMPRSGGDYIFISRILHPSLGFIASWSMAVLCAFFAAFNAWSMGNWVLPDLLAPLGVMTGNTALINLAAWVAQPTVVISIIVICFALYFLIIYRGAKFSARTQWIPVIFTALALVVGVPTLLSTSSSTYLANFNHFAAYYHTSAAQLEAIAAKGGANLNPTFNWGSTLGFWPYVMVIFGYAVNSIMLGGEIRNPRRAQYISVIGSTVAAAAILTLFFGLSVSKVPTSLLSAFGYFTYVNGGANPIPFVIYGHVPIALGSSNPLFLILISGAVGFGLFFSSIGLYLWGTRYMFAWAFDRIAPPQVGELVGSRNTPLVALVVLTVLGLVFGIMLQIQPNFSYVTGSLLQAILFLFTAIAAIIFPFRLRQLYRGSIKWEIGGVPWISILGVWATIFMLIMIYFYATNSAFGAVTGSSIEFAGIVIGVAILYYIGAWLVARRNGYDLSLAYKEIPPE